MSLRAALALLAVGLFAACQPDATADQPHRPKLTTAEAEECDFWGGEVISGGLGGEVCQRPTSDAGQACDAESDCEGLCLAETRQCSEVTPLFGCHRIVTYQDEVAVICID